MRLVPGVFLASVMSWPAFGQTYTVSTLAGNGTAGFAGDNGPATSAQLHGPYGVAVDSKGNVYISDSGNNVVRKVSNGVITTVAGNTTASYGGDGGLATGAQLNAPYGLAVDSAGNLYIADSTNNVIRMVSNGIITTVAGNGTSGYTGDGGAATSAELALPDSVAVDSAGNLYIADFGNNVIRKVSGGVITTVAGNGGQGYGGDNGPPTSAELYQPMGVAVDSAGNLYIADTVNCRIRKVSNGIITTVAGDGTAGFSGDGGAATSAEVNEPYGLAVDSAGNLFIADTFDNRIRKVSNGVITTIAGTATGGYSGDGGAAAIAELFNPTGVAVDSADDIYIADFVNNRVRAMTLSSCTYSVGSTSLQAPASGGDFTVAIQTGAYCQWAVSGLPGWIAVSGAASGAGPATIILAAFPNNSGASLSTTVSVAGISVKVTQPAATTAALSPILAVTNAASYASGTVSPGEIVTLFGASIGPATPAYATIDPSTGKLATTIGGVQVLFNGTPAPMIYAGSTQISAVVPYEMALVGNPAVWVKYSNQTSNAYPLTTAPTAPGLFTQNSQGSGPGSILNQDYSVNGPTNAAAKGTIVMLYLTGEGQTNPPGVTGAITTATLPPPQVTPAPVSAVTVTINGQPAPNVQYAGEAPGFVAGLAQINVQIPSNAPSGNLSIAVSIGGVVSQNGVTVSVK
jgi:uncharacterized protein (TIGR03437 family)